MLTQEYDVSQYLNYACCSVKFSITEYLNEDIEKFKSGFCVSSCPASYREARHITGILLLKEQRCAIFFASGFLKHTWDQIGKVFAARM